jgi:hypothetical protein
MRPRLSFLIFLTAFFLFFNKTGNAQEKNNSTFVVLAGTQTDVKPYTTAVEAADFRCYHLKDHRRNLRFDNGVIVELFSITEMLGKGINFNSNCIPDESKLQGKAPLYHLTETGMIVESHDDIDFNRKK